MMTAKQRMATGFLAMLIVGSVAVMPAGADIKRPVRIMPQPPVSPQARVIAAELPAEQVRDLTYN